MTVGHRLPYATVDEHARALRWDVTRRESPFAIALVGVVILIAPVIEFVEGGSPVGHYAISLLVSITLISAALILHRWKVPLPWAPWVHAGAMVAAVSWLLYDLPAHPDSPTLAYVVIIMTALGSIILAWLAFIVAEIAIFVGLVILLATTGIADPVTWGTGAAVAALTGGLLLRLRVNTLMRLATARARAEEMATIDELTGLLTRRGFDTSIPGLVGTAMRLGQPVVATFIDIDGLKAANDRWGHPFGDGVIRAVAHAIDTSIREGDIAVRWGGDEFVVVGIGISPANTGLQDRIATKIRSANIDPRKWRGTVSIGTASGMPQVFSIEQLISLADQAMYRQRTAA